jgi:KipI family sensor histidine kinase inhibitor
VGQSVRLACPTTDGKITCTVKIVAASDSSLLVSFGDNISLEAHRQVLRLMQTFDEPLPGIRNLHPAFASVLIDFDPRRRTHAEIETRVRQKLSGAGETAHPESLLVEIPVCYGGEFGPDLTEVARHTGLSAERVVELHASAEYRVFFLGFSPGFPYLGGMPPELAMPRLSAPRKHVPVGSVAIGGAQTGIYSVDSPGGWRLIGRTSMRLFDAAAEPPAVLQMGNRVRLIPVKELPR